MKRIFESFDEIASVFCSSWLHAVSHHSSDECMAWQHGVCEFAKLLDGVGLKIVANPDYDSLLFDAFNNHKPETFVEHMEKP